MTHLYGCLILLKQSSQKCIRVTVFTVGCKPVFMRKKTMKLQLDFAWSYYHLINLEITFSSFFALVFAQLNTWIADQIQNRCFKCFKSEGFSVRCLFCGTNAGYQLDQSNAKLNKFCAPRNISKWAFQKSPIMRFWKMFRGSDDPHKSP